MPSSSGPSTCEDPTGQIETMTNAATQGVDAVMISNNAGEQIQSGRRRRHGRRRQRW